VHVRLRRRNDGEAQTTLYDCSIDLLSEASLPSRHLCNISQPEKVAMEKHIIESLNSGIISLPVRSFSLKAKKTNPFTRALISGV